ncbi:MAG: SAM-dependent methyltransferase [Candidatus Bipolaricaulota bacterium]
MSFWVLITLLSCSIVWVLWNSSLDAWWQPTDHTTVKRILDLADIRPDDIIYDLGCGDGRIVVEAAKQYGIRGVGIEIDPLRVAISWLRALFAGQQSRVTIKMGNMYRVDLRQADVVVLFLSASSNRKLAPKLSRELEEGSRIVSYYHELPGWDSIQRAKSRDGHLLYLYQKGVDRDDNASS